MRNRISITQWVEKEKNGDFEATDFKTMIAAGWFDWFCTDESLHKRLKKMRSMIQAVIDCPAIDNNNHYIFFKNNCPINGSSYDSFSVCKLDSEDVVWWISGKCTHSGNAEVVHRSDFEGNELPEDDRSGVRSVNRFFKNLTTRKVHEIIVKNSTNKG